MGRLWAPERAGPEAAALRLTWTKSGSTLILCGVIDGPAAPAVDAVPTPSAATVAEAVSTAASFSFSGEIRTNMTPLG